MELVILCGLQAAGKSTFRRERFSGHVVVSKDHLRNNRRKELRQRKLVAEALSGGQSVVVDNTKPAVADRAPLIDIGRRFGARIVGFYFEADFVVSAERNASRSGRERVPVVGIADTARRLHRPRMDEGFDELSVVRAVDGRFELRPAANTDPV